MPFRTTSLPPHPPRHKYSSHTQTHTHPPPFPACSQSLQSPPRPPLFQHGHVKAQTRPGPPPLAFLRPSQPATVRFGSPRSTTISAAGAPPPPQPYICTPPRLLTAERGTSQSLSHTWVGSLRILRPRGWRASSAAPAPGPDCPLLPLGAGERPPPPPLGSQPPRNPRSSRSQSLWEAI